MGSKSKLAERERRTQRVRRAAATLVLGITLLLGWDAFRHYRMLYGSAGTGCKPDNEVRELAGTTFAF